MKPPPLIIGIGNRFRGDDGAGPAVAGGLRARGVDAGEMNGDGTELMELWTGRAWVIVVDAARSGAPSGTLHRFEAGTEPLPSGFFHYSTHQFGLAEAVETSRILGLLPSRLTVFGVEGRDFGFKEGLTPETARGCRETVEEIVEMISGFPHHSR
ncbi:MAG: hydrogenase maturation protease [Alphaproteobacteria bacterium]|nr:hydrogenase maturation protease [Alphaproteobacteria bacterium]